MRCRVEKINGLNVPDDYEPLVEASRRLISAGFTRHHLMCYVLIGFPNDSIEDATYRLTSVKHLGMCPMAMLWRNNNESVNPVWAMFQREWARPALIYKSKGNF